MNDRMNGCLILTIQRMSDETNNERINNFMTILKPKIKPFFEVMLEFYHVVFAVGRVTWQKCVQFSRVCYVTIENDVIVVILVYHWFVEICFFRTAGCP